MFYSPRLYIRDWWISGSAIGIFLSQIFIWWFIIYNIHPSPDQFFLHYNVTFGVDLAGEWWKLLYLPLSGLIVFITNYILSFYFYNAEKLLARLVALLAGVFHIFLIIATVLIVNLNV